jgi:hypothetical protein
VRLQVAFLYQALVGSKPLVMKFIIPGHGKVEAIGRTALSAVNSSRTSRARPKRRPASRPVGEQQPRRGAQKRRRRLQLRLAARGGGGAGGPFRGISRRVNPRPAAVGPPAKVNKPFYIADLPNNKTVKRGRLFHPFGLLVSFGSARDLLPCLDQLEDDNIIAQLWIRSRTENGN